MPIDETVQAGWIALNVNATTTDDAALAATTKTYALKSSLAADLKMDTNGVLVMFKGGTGTAPADGGTFAWELYGYRLQGDAEFIASGTGTFGTQVDSAGARYADTLAITYQRWPATVAVADAAGDNGMAKIYFDALGIDYLYCGITTKNSKQVYAYYSIV